MKYVCNNIYNSPETKNQTNSNKNKNNNENNEILIKICNNFNKEIKSTKSSVKTINNNKQITQFMIHSKMSGYIKKLTKNYLSSEDPVNINLKKYEKFEKEKIMKEIKHKKKILQIAKINNSLNKKISDEELINLYYKKINNVIDNQNNLPIKDSQKMSFDTYANNYNIYQHPRLYKLKDKNNIKIINSRSDKKILPNINTKPFFSLHNDFSNEIPEKLNANNNENKKFMYGLYKTIKSKKSFNFHL